MAESSSRYASPTAGGGNRPRSSNIASLEAPTNPQEVRKYHCRRLQCCLQQEVPCLLTQNPRRKSISRKPFASHCRTRSLSMPPRAVGVAEIFSISEVPHQFHRLQHFRRLPRPLPPIHLDTVPQHLVPGQVKRHNRRIQQSGMVVLLHQRLLFHHRPLLRTRSNLLQHQLSRVMVAPTRPLPHHLETRRLCSQLRVTGLRPIVTVDLRRPPVSVKGRRYLNSNHSNRPIPSHRRRQRRDIPLLPSKKARSSGVLLLPSRLKDTEISIMYPRQ